MGGGILSVGADELSTVCKPPNQFCFITQHYNLIENHNPNLSIGSIMIQGNQDGITITKFHNHKNAKIIFDTNIQVTDSKSKIINFINEGTIISNTTTEIIRGEVQHFTNHGSINAGIIGNIDAVTNTGTMGGINASNFTINNTGVINLYGVVAKDKGNLMAHITSDKLTIQNYSIRINENQATFNSFSGYKATSDNPTKDEFVSKTAHLVVSHSTGNGNVDITFGANAKIFIDIDLNSFQLGKMYSISKILTDEKGSGLIDASYFKYLTLKDPDIYEITQNGDLFVIKFAGGGGGDGAGSGGGGGSNSIVLHTPITELYKANIHTMNNFWTLSNAMIYPRKLYHSQNLTRKYPSLLDSAISLKSYESFSYRNESINRRIQRQNKRNYSRTKRNNSPVILNDSEESQKKNNRDSSPKAQNDNGRKSQTQRFSQNLAQNPNNSQTTHNYYFILTPFLNHNSFTQSGNYNLSGFDYGFLTAFSTQVAESNSLGAHFIFSYGNLGDKKDKDLSIKSLNLNVGLNYKLDLIYDMYLKARGDFYYFSNALDSLTIKNIKPNNLGFGVSVSYGKDFNFGKGGMLGIEAGIDYKALKTNEVSLNSQTYKQSLYNLIYADLGVNYNKYFGDFGINLGSGFKANLAPKLAESTLLINTQNLRFVLDNDKYLAYANAGISYLLNTKNFDMEFSVAYYGNYGDRVISNGGGVELRVVF